MLQMDKRPIYYNQLNFNLDAHSPATSYLSDPFTPPPFVFVQKFPKKPNVSCKQQDHTVKVPIKSDRLALAIQLAKLDVSNSRSPQPSAPKLSDKICEEKKKPKTKVVWSNENRRKAPKLLHDPNVHNQATNTNKRFYNNFYPNKSPRNTHVPLTPVKRNVALQESAFPKRDAHTSTSDLGGEFNNLFNVPTMKSTHKPNRSFIKKETLRKQFNHLPAHKSGYMSHYRSPSRKKDRKLRFDKSFEVISKSGGHSQPMRVNFSPKCPNSRPCDFDQRLVVDDATDTSSFCSYGSSKNSFIAPQISTKDRIPHVALNYPRRRNFSDYPCNAGPSNKPKQCKQPLLDLYYEDAKHDINPLESTQISDSGCVAANDVRNTPTYETLLQRLTDIEHSEKVIRHRWCKIKYDDIAGHKSKIDNLVSDTTESSSSYPIHISGGKDTSFVGPVKEIVRFVQPKVIPKDLTSATTSLASPRRKKIGLSKESINSIKNNKSEFQRYLHMAFHKPKGNFNPWKLVKDLSNDIVRNIIDDVCDEVNDGFEGCVEQLFENEFAEPNYSISTAESSHQFSTFDHGNSPPQVINNNKSLL